MTKIIKFILLTLLCFESIAQSVTIDPSSNNSKILEVNSKNKGFMPPKMTTTERKAISNPEIGLLVFDTNKSRLYMFDGQNWMPLAVSSSDGIDYVQRTATNDSQGSYFGWSVAIDNNWAVVGAPNDSVGNVKKGCVYIFKRENNNWKQKFKIQNNDSQVSFFGQSVDIQGTTIVVSSSYRPTSGPGLTFVYNIVGFTLFGQYVETSQFVQTINPPSIYNVAASYFGQVVKIHNDRIFIGDDNCSVNNINNGAVFIYQKVNNSWVYQSYLTSTITPENEPIKFGHSIEASGDYLFVGAPSDRDYYNLGAVFVYVYGGGTYTLQQRITKENSVFFGNKLASDGEYLFVTYALVDDDNAGAVAAFKRTGSNWEFANAPYIGVTNPSIGIGLAYHNGIVAISNGYGNINLYNKIPGYFQKFKTLYSDDTNLFGDAYDIDSNYLITGYLYGQKVTFVNIEEN